MGLLDKFFGPKPPGKDKFAKMVIAGIQRAGEKGKIVYDPKQFRLFREGEEGTRLSVGSRAHRPFSHRPHSKPMIRGTVCANARTYGSVGGPGG